MNISQTMYLLAGNFSVDAGNIPELSGSDIFDGLINGAFALAGLLAVVAIIVGGYWYVFSQGDSSRIAKGKNAILYGVVGLIVVLVSFLILQLTIAAVSGEF